MLLMIVMTWECFILVKLVTNYHSAFYRATCLILGCLDVHLNVFDFLPLFYTTSMLYLFPPYPPIAGEKIMDASMSSSFGVFIIEMH